MVRPWSGVRSTTEGCPYSSERQFKTLHPADLLHARGFQGALHSLKTIVHPMLSQFYGVFLGLRLSCETIFIMDLKSSLVPCDIRKSCRRQDVDCYDFDLDRQRVETKEKVGRENRKPFTLVSGRKNIPRSTLSVCRPCYAWR